MNLVKRVVLYLKYILLARNTKGYGVHSPFLFHFTRFVVMEQNKFYAFDAIEKERKRLLNDNSLLVKQDFGTGSNGEYTVKNIARRSLCSRRKGELLYRIVNCFDLNNQLELGTSFGISTAYMASSSASVRNCITIEGCENTAQIARQVWRNLELNKIQLIVGEISDEINSAIAKLSVLDFVLIDANHSLKATCTYFEAVKPFLSNKSIVVVDDIYWSEEMMKAWEYIKEDSSVTATIDFFHFGIVFVNPDLHKQNYRMRFKI